MSPTIPISPVNTGIIDWLGDIRDNFQRQICRMVIYTIVR